MSVFSSSSGLLNTTGESHSVFQALLTFWGFHAGDSALAKAEHEDLDVLQNVNAAHALDELMQDQSSGESLQQALQKSIEKLEITKSTALALSESAFKRSNVNENSSLSLRSVLTEKAKRFFGSDDSSLQTRYLKQAQQAAETIQTLKGQQQRLTQSLTARSSQPGIHSTQSQATRSSLPPEIHRRLTQSLTTRSSPPEIHRRLLASPTLPSTKQVFCAPSGSGNLSALRDGVSGFALYGEMQDDNSGISVSGLGDINGDGVKDIVIGAERADPNGLAQAGKSYVVFGSRNNVWGTGRLNISSLMDGVRGFVLQGGNGGEFSGHFVSSAGDVNGDLISDVLVGAYGVGGGVTYVVFGSSNLTAWGNGTLNLSTLADGQRGFLLQGESAGDQSGLSASNAGDVNGDGVSDLIIGAPFADPLARPDAGKTYVVFGSKVPSAWGNGRLNLSNFTDGIRGFVLQGEFLDDQSGEAVSSAGDVNGDGISDMLIGALQADPGGRGGAGKTYVVFGSNLTNYWGSGVLNLSSLMNGLKGFALEGESGADASGRAVSAGDINGDGLSDILVGASGANGNAGKTYVIFGSTNTSSWGGGSLILTTFVNGQTGFVLQGQTMNDASGYFVSAGDVNLDGFSDVVVGAYFGDPESRVDAGNTWVVFGSGSNSWGGGSLGLNSSFVNGAAGFLLQGEVTTERSGWSVSTCDMNGDGVSDILIGAPLSSPPVPGRAQAGATYVVFGSNFYFSNNKLLINVNQSIVVGVGNLNVASSRTANMSQTLFTVSNVTHGRFTLVTNTLVNLTTFYFYNILNGDIKFVHDGSGFPPSYSVSATNPLMSPSVVISSDAQITFSLCVPVLQTNRLSVIQGVAVILHRENLNATDCDDPEGELTFTVANVSHGEFWEYLPNGSIFAKNISHFTQQAITDGLIDFVHDGSHIPPSFSVSVNDNKTTTVYQPAEVSFFYEPDLHLQPIIVDQGQSTVMLFANFNVTAQQTRQEDIVISVANITGGFFLHTDEFGASQPAFWFPQSELMAGQIAFVADRNATQVNFSVSADDGFLSTPWQFPVISVNRRPVLSREIGDRNVTKNKLFTLTLPVDTFVDPDHDTLTYQAQLRGGGPLPKDIAFSFPPLTFSGLLLGEDALEIQLTASDPRGVSTSAFFMLENLNLPPQLFLRPILVDQGAPSTLNYQDINATDKETLWEDLLIEAGNLTGGFFIYETNPELPLSAFRQLALILGTVQFLQDGSDVVPSFALRAKDGTYNSPWRTANITLNYRPRLKNQPSNQEESTGSDFRFDYGPSVFDSVDGDSLTYTAHLQNGGPLPLGLSFLPPGNFEGNLPTAGTLLLQIEAKDPRGLSAVARFSLTTRAGSGVTVESVISTVSTIGGIVLAILAYFWWRLRVTQHRQGFEFANTLRKAANLEYHDFMRFDGDIYKSKIDQFLNHLHYSHNKFFANLKTQQERESFAVCVSDFLITRGLVESSDCGWGTAGMLLLFSTGWAQKMDLRAFDDQMIDIAAACVRAWKLESNPCLRWPYKSPTKKDKLKACCSRRGWRQAGAYSPSRHLTKTITLQRIEMSDIKEGEESETKSLLSEQKLLQNRVAALELRMKELSAHSVSAQGR